MSLVLVATGVVVIAAPTQAATTGWPQDVSDVQNDYIQSTPDGSVIAANCSEAPTAIKVFSAAGALTSSVPQRTDGIYTKSCYSQGAVSKDGTVFGIAEDSYTKFAVVAYRGTTKLWERHFPHYCSNIGQTTERAINTVTVGTDGFVYAATIPFQCFNGFYLSKLNPSTGQVVFEKQVGRYTTVFLGTSSKGLVSQDNAGVIRYFRYDGTEFAPAVTAAGWVRSIDNNARAFTVGTSGDSCSTSALRMYTPGTATPFTFSLPACWQIQHAQATSQNGVAVLAYNQNSQPTVLSYAPSTSGGFTARSVTLPDTDEYRHFKLEAPYPSYLPAYINTDTNGNILVVREYQWQRGDTVLTAWQFTLQATNLNVLAEYDTGAFDFQQTTRFARSMHWAMAKDKLYVAVGYCTTTDPYQCGEHSVSLYAARMVRLSLDYPRGAVLGVAPTTVTCKPVTFVGVRGSGEDAFAYEGLGQTVQHIKDRLVAAGVTNMEVVAVAYPATPADYFSGTYPPDYRDSVGAGIDAVNSVLLQINRDCPTSQIVVAGYSQGAHATDGIRFLPAAVQNQIKAMALAGDPLFNPALTTVNKGTFSTLWYGVWVTPSWPYALPARQFSTNMSGKVVSYCLADDIVCNISPNSVAICSDPQQVCPHTLYRPTWTQQAATWIRGKITP